MYCKFWVYLLIYFFICLRIKRECKLRCLYPLLWIQVLLKLFWMPYKSSLPGMVTTHLEVLQAHSFQQRWICQISRAGCLHCSLGCVLAGRGGKKSRLKAETPETLMSAQQQKGMQGLQSRTAEQALGVIFSSPASLLKAMSDGILWFWTSLNLYFPLLTEELW